MRHLVSIIVLVLFFIGCSVKEQVVEVKMPPKKEQIKKPNKVLPKKEVKPIIKEVTPVQIQEETIPFLENTQQLKIAIVYSSKMVSKYASGAISTTMGYLSFRNLDYNLKVIDIDDESVGNIQRAFEELNELEINNVIALFTPLSINSLQRVNVSNLRVYLPLIEKGESLALRPNYIYGSISYEAQVKKLLDYSSGNYAMFYQDSFLGNKLRTISNNLGVGFSTSKEIQKDKNNYKSLVNDYRLNNSVLFMNTDVVKTSLLLSQLTAFEINPKVILSTQLNFAPELIALTQEKDRDNLILANSINDIDERLADEIEFFGGNIKYEWVDYSVLIGVDYLYDHNNSGLVKEQISDNKVVYNPRLFKCNENGFLEIK